MKKISGFVVGMVVLLLCSYWGMGYLTKRALEKNIAILCRNNSGVLALQQYHQGLFHATAELQWTVKLPQHLNQHDKVYVWHMPLTIWHGPVMWIAGKPALGLGFATSELTLPADYAAQFATLYDPTSLQPALKISAFVTYLRNTALTLSIPPFKLLAKLGKNQFDFLGMHAHVIWVDHKQQLKGQVQLKGLSWRKDALDGNMGPIAADYNIHQGFNGFYLGTAHFRVPSFILTENSEPLATVTAADLVSTSDIKNGLLQSDFELNAQKIAINPHAFNNAHVHLALLNLDAKILADINRKMTQSRQSAAIEKQRILLSIIPELPALLGKGARLTMSKLSLQLSEGTVQGSLDIVFPNQQIANPFRLLQKIKGNSHLRISTAVLKTWLHHVIQQKMANASLETVAAKVDEKINALQSMGILSAEANDYILKFQYTNSKLFINGHMVTPSMFAV